MPSSCPCANDPPRHLPFLQADPGALLGCLVEFAKLTKAAAAAAASSSLAAGGGGGGGSVRRQGARREIDPKASLMAEIRAANEARLAQLFNQGLD